MSSSSSSSDVTASTQSEFMSLVSSLPSNACRQAFFSWLEQTFLPEFSESVSTMAEPRKVLRQLSQHIRVQLPEDAVTESERHVLRRREAVHLDAFLLDEMDLDEMDTNGGHVCNVCGSNDTRALETISHSCSIERLEFIFLGLLPNLKGKKVLDVGARTGAVLYAAYLFTEAKEIVGVELNAHFASLMNSTVTNFNMGDRIRIVNDDILNAPNELASADVIVLNNVFEWFTENEEKETVLWTYLRASIKKGALLVTVPDLQSVAERLKLNNLFDQWVIPLKATQPEQCARNIVVEENESVFLYKVIRPQTT